MKSPSNSLSRYVVPDMPSADELLPYLRQIDANRWYSNFGPLVTQFEDGLGAYLSSLESGIGVPPLHLTTVMTCYHALQIGLQLFRMPPNAKVLVPAVTFPACPLAVRHAGAEAVLADVDPDRWQLTPETARLVAEKMTIHAVMPVAVYGVGVSADAWDKFTEDTGIPVIIDAAAALESQIIPKKCLVAHSLHATKPFSIGEGGVLVSRRREQIEEARCISNFGTYMRIAKQDGTNAKMSEYHGAVGLAQLNRWQDVKERRRKTFLDYLAALEKADIDIALQKDVENSIVGTLMLQVSQGSAQKITNEFIVQGITAHRMYLPPLYNHPHFAGLTVADTQGKLLPGSAAPDQKAKLMINSEMLQRSLFGVPFHSFMSADDIDCVVDRLLQTVGCRPVQSARAM